jgi:modulator of FtsH protease
MSNQIPFSRTQPSNGFGRAQDTLRTNTVLRNTYMLLAASLLTTSGAAWLTMQMGLPYPGMIVSLLGSLGGMALIYFLRESPLALLFVFLWTAFQGYILGPLLSFYVHGIPDGSSIIMTAFGITGGTFVGLSAYVLATGSRFGRMANFLFAGLLVAVLLSVVSIFVHMTALSLTISAIMAVVSVGYILYDTGEIVNGGQTNFVMATVRLYLDLLNLFLSVLRLLSASSNR